MKTAGKFLVMFIAILLMTSCASGQPKFKFTILGRLDVNGAIYQKGKALHADYVFESEYRLESIEEHAGFMWSNKHLKAVPKAKVDENDMEIVEVGAHRRGIVEELEKAHIYIERLHQRLNELEKKLASLEVGVNSRLVQHQ